MKEIGKVYKHPKSGDKYKLMSNRGSYVYLIGLERGDNLHVHRQIWDRDWK